MSQTDAEYEIIQVVEATLLAFAAVLFTAGSVVAGGSFLGVRFWTGEQTRADVQKANRLRTAMLTIAAAMLFMSLSIFIIWNKNGRTKRSDDVVAEYTRWAGLLIGSALLVWAYALYAQVAFYYALGGSAMIAFSHLSGLFATLVTVSNQWVFFLIVWALLNLIGIVMIAAGRNIHILPWGADIWAGVFLEVMFLANGLWLILGPEVSGGLNLWITSLLYLIISFLTALIPAGLISLTFWATKRLTSPSESQYEVIEGKLHSESQLGRNSEVFDRNTNNKKRQRQKRRRKRASPTQASPK